MRTLALAVFRVIYLCVTVALAHMLLTITELWWLPYLLVIVTVVCVEYVVSRRIFRRFIVKVLRRTIGRLGRQEPVIISPGNQVSPVVYEFENMLRAKYATVSVAMLSTVESRRSYIFLLDVALSPEDEESIKAAGWNFSDAYGRYFCYLNFTKNGERVNLAPIKTVEPLDRIRIICRPFSGETRQPATVFGEAIIRQSVSLTCPRTGNVESFMERQEDLR